MDSSGVLFDVLIIGGGPAGLAAATVLGRAHRRVALVDTGEQSNRQALEVHAVFSRDCCPPPDLYAAACSQLRRYASINQIQGCVERAVALEDAADGAAFAGQLADGGEVRSVYLLLAQGVNYAFPPIPGIAELWGRQVWHCPYCHGFEATGKRLLAIGDAQWVGGMGEVLPVWTPHITWVALASVTALAAAANGIVATVDGRDLAFDQAVVQTTVIPRDGLADSLGCTRNGKGQLIISEGGGTNIPGVFAAGDQTTEGGQVNIAAAAGHKAGVALNELLGIPTRPMDALLTAAVDSAPV
jgi:thioredoxin reductase